jgi:hypothetical protein
VDQELVDVLTKAALKQLCTLLAAGGIGAGGQVAYPKLRDAVSKPAVVRTAVRPVHARAYRPALFTPAMPVMPAPVLAPDCIPALQPVRIEGGMGELLPGIAESRVPVRPGDRFVIPGTPVWAGPMLPGT